MTGQVKNYNSLDECVNDNYSLTSRLYKPVGHNHKQQRLNKEDVAPILFVKVLKKHKYKDKIKTITKTIKTLVDPGSSSSLVSDKSIIGHPKYKSTRTWWETTAGMFETNKKVNLNFKMSELSETAIVNHQFNVSKSPLGQYDMIIGRDLANQIGLDTCGSDLTVKWPKMNAEIPYKPSKMGEQECYYIQDPDSLQGKTDRMSQILDAKYSKADIYKITREVKTLNEDKPQRLKHILRTSESLFDSTLGRWVGDPYKIKLRADATPFHAKPFPVPYAYEKMLRMEVERLRKIGVLKRVNHSEYASPSFIISKRIKQSDFLMTLEN